MRFQEYGAGHEDTVLLLHGGGLSWWNYREAAAFLQDRFRVILPILDGHAGSDRPFTSIWDNAQEILGFISEHCGGRVLTAGGLSLGGQVLLEMLSLDPGFCSNALIESASVLPSAFTNALIGPAFGSSYGLIQNRTFAKLQFASLHMKPDLFEDYYRDTCAISKSDMIAFMKASVSYDLKKSFADTSARVSVLYGQKETAAIRRSAEKIARELPSCSLRCLPGLYHGEFSISHAREYADTVAELSQG